MALTFCAFSLQLRWEISKSISQRNIDKVLLFGDASEMPELSHRGDVNKTLKTYRVLEVFLNICDNAIPKQFVLCLNDFSTLSTPLTVWAYTQYSLCGLLNYLQCNYEGL